MFLSGLIYHIPFWSAPAERGGDGALDYLATTFPKPRAVATGSFSISHFPFTIGRLEDSFVIAQVQQ